MLKLGVKRVGSVVFGRVLAQRGLRYQMRLVTLPNKYVHGLSTSGAGPRFACSTTNTILCVHGSDSSKNEDWFAKDFGDVKGAKAAVVEIEGLVLELTHPVKEREVECNGLDIIETT